MKAIPNLDFAVVKPTEPSLKYFAGMLRKVYQNLVFVINGNLGFGDGTSSDNVSGSWINTTTPGAANTDFTANHNLNRLPVGYWIMQKDRAVDIYTGSVAATKTQITLRATVASAVVRLFVICLLFAFGASAQTTTITLQVTDSGGQSWNNGSWSVVLASPPGTSPFGPPFNLIAGGGTVPNQSQTGALSGTGSATMTLTQNSAIAPGGSQWKYTVCPQATSSPPTAPPVCFSQFVTITAVTTVTLTPPPVTVQAGATTTAYSDNEVVAFIGQQYFNLTSGVPRVCTAPPQGQCTTWAVAGGTPLVPVGNNGDLQMKNGAALAASHINDNGSVLNHTEDSQFIGPNPYVDIRNFGARPIDYTAAPAVPGVTANCVSGSANVTISSASTFINGDGVVLYGCGSDTIAAPAAPTVTPSLAAAQTGTELDVPGLTGSTTYCYQLVARSLLGATNVSPETCTTTGAASLGLQTNTITTVSLSNTTATYTTSAPHGLVVGAHIVVTGVTVPLGADSNLDPFIGWFLVNTVPDSTHFTVNLLSDSRAGGITSGTGGTVNYWNCNRIVATELTNNFQYYVYGRVSGGSKTIIGTMWPQDHALAVPPIGPDPTYLVFDDFGSPVSTLALPPIYIPNTVPTTATNGMLATTIVSGAGTTSLTLANNAGNTINGQTILFDDAITFAAAAAYAASNGSVGPVMLPDIGSVTPFNHFVYIFNSPLTLSQITVLQKGALQVNEPITMSGGVTWEGDPSSGQPFNAFGFGSRASFSVVRASPAIYVQTNCEFRHISISTRSANGSTFYIQENGGTPMAVTFDNVEFVINSGTTYSNIGILFRGGGSGVYAKNLLMSSQQNGNLVGTTPGIYFDGAGDFVVDRVNFSGVGFALRPNASGNLIKADTVYCQGCYMPLFSITGGTIGGAPVRFLNRGSTRDTTAQYIPLLANYGGSLATLEISGAVPQAGPLVTGSGAPAGSTRTTILSTSSSLITKIPLNLATSELNQIYPVNDGIFGSNTNIGVDVYRRSISIGQGFSLFTTTWLYPAPVCTVSAGGSVPVGTLTYTFVPIFPNGSEGQTSLGCSATTTPGNQTVTVSWTAVPSVTQYQVARNGREITNSPTTGVIFVDTFSSTTGFNVSQTAVGGPAGMQNGKMWAQSFSMNGNGSPVGPVFNVTDSTNSNCPSTTGDWTTCFTSAATAANATAYASVGTPTIRSSVATVMSNSTITSATATVNISAGDTVLIGITALGATNFTYTASDGVNTYYPVNLSTALVALNQQVFVLGTVAGAARAFSGTLTVTVTNGPAQFGFIVLDAFNVGSYGQGNLFNTGSTVTPTVNEVIQDNNNIIATWMAFCGGATVTISANTGILRQSWNPTAAICGAGLVTNTAASANTSVTTSASLNAGTAWAVNGIELRSVTTVQPTIYFPAGRYTYTSGLSFPNTVTLKGEPGAVLCYGGVAHAIDLGSASLTFATLQPDPYIVDGLRFECGAGMTQGIFLNAHSIYVEIKNNVFYNFGNTSSSAIFSNGDTEGLSVKLNHFLIFDGSPPAVYPNVPSRSFINVTTTAAFSTLAMTNNTAVCVGSKRSAGVGCGTLSGPLVTTQGYANFISNNNINGGFCPAFALQTSSGTAASTRIQDNNIETDFPGCYAITYQTGIDGIKILNNFWSNKCSTPTSCALLGPSDGTQKISNAEVSNNIIVNNPTNNAIVAQNNLTGQINNIGWHNTCSTGQFSGTTPCPLLHTAGGNINQWNNDYAGTCTMNGSTGCSVYNFLVTYGVAPKCTSSWTGSGTLAGVIKTAVSTSALTITSSTSTDTAVVNWTCNPEAQ